MDVEIHWPAGPQLRAELKLAARVTERQAQRCLAEARGRIRGAKEPLTRQEPRVDCTTDLGRAFRGGRGSGAPSPNRRGGLVLQPPALLRISVRRGAHAERRAHVLARDRSRQRSLPRTTSCRARMAFVHEPLCPRGRRLRGRESLHAAGSADSQTFLWNRRPHAASKLNLDAIWAALIRRSKQGDPALTLGLSKSAKGP